MEYVITFPSLDRGQWLKTIADARYTVEINSADNVILDITCVKSIDELQAVHLVTFACLIEDLTIRNKGVGLKTEIDEVVLFFFKDIGMPRYFNERVNFVESETETIFNLWRVNDSEKESRSYQIAEYLEKHFFKNKDLSAVQLSIVEAYYNIFDHANAGGNAWSYMVFNPKRQKLYVAICDFGIGIARKVREHLPGIKNDADAIERAMEDRFTTRSQQHNGGRGLGSIRYACTEEDVLRIVSRSGLLFVKRDMVRKYTGNFLFPGTLIYYELSLNHFEDKEIMDTFEL